MWWIIGVVGWLMVFYGVYLLGNKDIKGFYWNLAAEMLLIFDAILFGHYSLVFSCLVFTCLNIWNVIKWKRRKWMEALEAQFFEENPQFTMQVLVNNIKVEGKSKQVYSVEISHDTHDFPDAYFEGTNETKLRKQAVQAVLEKLK